MPALIAAVCCIGLPVLALGIMAIANRLSKRAGKDISPGQPNPSRPTGRRD